MAHVITQKCAGTCDTACVQVCPVACIHGPIDVDALRALGSSERVRASVGLQLYIDPVDCIDCGACVPECPVDAIYVEEQVPSEFHADIAANAAFFAQRGRAR